MLSVKECKYYFGKKGLHDICIVAWISGCVHARYSRSSLSHSHVDLDPGVRPDRRRMSLLCSLAFATLFLSITGLGRCGTGSKTDYHSSHTNNWAVLVSYLQGERESTVNSN